LSRRYAGTNRLLPAAYEPCRWELEKVADLFQHHEAVVERGTVELFNDVPARCPGEAARAIRLAMTDLLALRQRSAERPDRRLAGLTDAEYLWSPIAGGWTVYQGPAGWTYQYEFAPPALAPFTDRLATRACRGQVFVSDLATVSLSVRPRGASPAAPDQSGVARWAVG